ncbi:MAG: DUF2461 domain-containing protein [Burkholderiaceae bacterium]
MHLRDLTRFLKELEENNNRAWFVMNKPRYDILRAEFLALVSELITDVTAFDPAVAACNPKKALFRIHRDLRFARDKQPYKTYFSASITETGLKKPSQGGGPAYYFHIDAQGKLLVAGGEYQPPPDRLRRIREHIVADPDGFAAMLADARMRRTFGDLQPEGRLTRLPKGFDLDAPHPEYLKLKSCIVWKETDVDAMRPERLPDEILDGFRAALPLVRWLRAA